MDLFASAVGHVVSCTHKTLVMLTHHHRQTEMISIAYDSFWRHTALHERNMMADTSSSVANKYLNINPEGLLFREAQDIAEELKIMKRIYSEQLSVTKDLKRHLHDPLEGGDETTAALKRLLLKIVMDQGKKVDNERNGDEATTVADDGGEGRRGTSKALEGTLHEAEGTLELIESRQAEIQDLEDSALRTCQQVRQRNIPSTKRKCTS